MTMERFKAKRLPIVEVWRHGHKRLGCAPRCCAPGCGGKIKPGVDDTAILLEDKGGNIYYLEDECEDIFENGDPYEGGIVGRLVWDEDEGEEQ